jgi:asparagine synthase
LSGCEAGVVRRYWSWDFCNQEIQCLSFGACVDRATELFDTAFREATRDLTWPYLLPISGGVDSRMVSVLASKNLAPDLIQPVTYAYSSNSQEYQIAKQVCEKLGLNSPELHRLNNDTYKKALDWMPRETGGMVAFFNCHLLDYLRSTGFRGNILTSAFSDGLCGYEAKGGSGASWESSEKVKTWSRFASLYGLDSKIIDETRADFNSLAKEWENSTISSFDEYLYIVERHSKFHLPLVNLWRRHCGTSTPFISNELLELFFSMSTEFRINKQLEQACIKKLNPSVYDVGSISSLILTGRTGPRAERIYHRSINFFNMLLRGIGLASMEVPSSRVTEQLAKALHTDLKPYYKSALQGLHSRGFITKKEMEAFTRPSLRVNERLVSQLTMLNAARVYDI